ncbi:metallophosphoesterase [Desulfogranum japonicum]|uniref:metallophosphoesterase n=1 Tax=Desulfogranum japonicum TaxID=231447 RepID=UPI000421E6D6|nr:metallophosphoesterase [Desulfogranum japonicum]
MEAHVFADLKKRIGERHLGKRLRIQVNYADRMFVRNDSLKTFHYENSSLFNTLVTVVLKGAFCYGRGAKNALTYKVREHEFTLRNLPVAFDGLRILHLSDIHADGIASEAVELCKLLETIRADVCVITGDYRFKTHSSHRETVRIMAKILQAINVSMGTWGILGNHDFIEFVSPLEEAGLSMLLNEAVSLDQNGSRIWLAGVDDDHLFHCADLGKTLLHVPPEDTVILLSHTPELYKKAALEEVDFFLCGHTHGGQICLPGGIPVITNASCPRRFCAGRWKFQNMQGYTSFGTGSSGVPVRFNCPPEIAVHTLRRK